MIRTHDLRLISILFDLHRCIALRLGGVRERCTASNDMSSELEGFRDVEPARLCDDLDVVAHGEVEVDGIRQIVGGLFEESILKSSADVQKVEIIPNVLRHIEDLAGTHDGVGVNRRIVATTTDMEADANNVEIEFLCLSE